MAANFVNVFPMEVADNLEAGEVNRQFAALRQRGFEFVHGLAAHLEFINIGGTQENISLLHLFNTSGELLSNLVV